MVAANTIKTTNSHTSKGTGDESHSPNQSHTDHVAPDVSAVVSLPYTKNCPNSDYCGPFVYTTDEQGFHDMLFCKGCKRAY